MIALVDQLSFNVRSAIVWSIAADIVRFHGTKSQIRLSVTRPCQYFCLRIYSETTTASVAFNLGTSAVLGNSGVGSELYGDDRQGYYLAVALRGGSRAVVAAVEEALHLVRPSKPEPTTPSTLCTRAVARLMRDRAFHELALVADPGVCAEPGEPWVQAFVQHFPSVYERTVGRQDCWEANRIWRLQTDTETKQVVLLDFETAEAVVPEGRRESLWALFEKNDRKLAPVVAWLEERL